jgi:2-polyprenyl-3-methyl-5-hydroxy-6-metoxy-1,4-benzoquinol methylase
VSWFRPHLETSLALIERVAADRSANIIDVGAGQSTLVDDLLARGYQNITVVDISKIALEATAERLGLAARRLKWMAADITQAVFQPDSYDVWHDRAVFHFLTTQDQRAAYVAKAAQAVRPGANIVISTFGVDGPDRCSGLDVVRYDAKSLHAEFGICFDLVESFAEFHQTPFGTMQQFQYCCLKKIKAAKPIPEPIDREGARLPQRGREHRRRSGT